jgi:tetratricopeptide (TPR) repeat protein
MPIAEPEERVQPQVEVPTDEDLVPPESVELEPEDVAELSAETDAEAAPEDEVESAPVEETEEEPGPEVSEEPRPAAQVSELTEDELDEMRAYTESHEDDVGARLALARALWQAGEAEEAMEHYEELVGSQDKMDDVLVDLERYYEARPSVPSLLRTLGDAYMKEGDLDKALAFYNRAMDLL